MRTGAFPLQNVKDLDYKKDKNQHIDMRSVIYPK